MEAESQGVLTQFVIGPAQALRRRDRRLYFPLLSDIGGTSSWLDRFRAAIQGGADLEALQAEFAAPPIPEFLDVEAFYSQAPILAGALDALDAANWREAMDLLRQAEPEVRQVVAHLESIHAAILAGLVGAAAPAADLGLRLLKAMWIARQVAESERLASAGFDGPAEAYVEKCWRIGNIVLGCRLPRSRHSPWPAPPPDADADSAGPATESAHDDRAMRLEAALRELEGAAAEQAIVDAAAAPVERPSPMPVRSKGLLDWLFGTASRMDPSPPLAVPAVSPAERRLDPGLRNRLSDSTKKALSEEGIALDSTGIEPARQLLSARAINAYARTRRAPPSVTAVVIGGNIVEIDRTIFPDPSCRPVELPCHCNLLASLDAKHENRSYVHVLGSGRAYRIDQTLLPYERGELVHTEPVLGGSRKKSSFRKLDRLEETDETLTEHETFEESEATTHDQFSLANEISKTVEQQQKTDMGASLTASYGGTVSVSANFDTSSATGAKQSEKAAVANAREVINKAVKRVRDRMESRHTAKRLSETERVDSFALAAPEASFTGFYRAIDKAYSNRLVLVGERVVIRVSMQHPMAYLLHCMTSRPTEGVTLSKPTDPLLGIGTLGKLESFKDITTTNYAAWAAAYDVEGIRPPPDLLKVTAEKSTDYTKEMKDVMAGSMSVSLPDGYECYWAEVNAVFSEGSGRYIHGHVGNDYYYTEDHHFKYCAIIPSIQSKVPISYRGNVQEYAINYVLWCAPTAEAVTKWKISVYDAILAAYRRKLEAYEAQVQAAQLSAGVQIAGRSPLKNRLLIEQELQKLVLGAVYPPLFYRGFDSMKFAHPCVDGVKDETQIVPEPDFADAHAECSWLTFFTQLFEWKNMVYQFQPYYLGQRPGWATLRRLQDDDPLFENALSAGQVLIDIPVAPHMTEPFLNFLQTGKTWDGHDMPITGDPHFVDLATAIRLSETLDDGKVCEDVKPWVTKVPTSLVLVTDTPPLNLA